MSREKQSAQVKALRMSHSRDKAFELCAEVSAGALVWYQGNPRVKLIACEKSPGFKVFVHPKRTAICNIRPGYHESTLHPAVSFDDGSSKPLYAPDPYNGLRMLTELIDCELGFLNDRKPS